ncbi:MAG: hypothetical protein ACTH5L_05970 [Halomonas sp.]|uniref:hypothetical protein n=1 Tax=Halomonas TaxID=2745 RepID=UPI0018672A45|nr:MULTISPECIES: hypothetical protein [Halomonas]
MKKQLTNSGGEVRELTGAEVARMRRMADALPDSLQRVISKRERQQGIEKTSSK